jgi:hypothetical protein
VAHKPHAELDHWQTFTKRIFTEWDADPGYYALQYSDLPADQMQRAAVAWCAYYNLGIAADASELTGKRFWTYLLKQYPTAKRASERRHFRGAAGLKALDQWATEWPRPESLAEHMCGGGANSYFSIRNRGRHVAQYGDYFYWKWCDLHEVLGYGPVDMTGSEKHSPKVPQQGAQLVYERYSIIDGLEPAEVVKQTYTEIMQWGKGNKVPPRTTKARNFGIQEAETVCCVYKQMAGGSYIYGTRTAKAVKRLHTGTSDTAKQMASTLLRLSPYTEGQLYAALDSLTEK